MTENSHKLTLEQAFQHGVSLYQQNSKAEARAVFEEILTFAPDAVPVLQVLAVLDSEQGLLNNAEQRLRAAADIAREDDSVLFDLAVVLKEQGKNLEALDWVELLLSRNPGQQELLAMRQSLTAKTGNKAESRRTAKAAETASSQRQSIEDEIQTSLDAVRQLIDTDNVTQAEALLKAILAIAPSHPDALLEKGKMLTASGALPEARQSFLLALQHTKNKSAATKLLIDCEVALTLYKEARSHCIDGLRESPDDETLLRRLLNIYSSEKNWAKVKETADTLLKINPAQPLLHYIRAEARFMDFRQRQNFTPTSLAECENTLTKALAKIPPEKTSKLKTFIAELKWYQGHPEEALALIKAYTDANPDDHEAAFNLTFIYKTLKQWKEHYEANERGIAAGLRLKAAGATPVWVPGENNDDIVLVMSEQGVGDEIRYYHNLSYVLERSKKVFVGCEPRLIPALSCAYPEAHFFGIKRQPGVPIQLPENVTAEITHWIAAGSLAKMVFDSCGQHVYKDSWINTPSTLQSAWQTKISALKEQSGNKPVIGLCWRSGLAAASRNFYYLNIKDVIALVNSIPDAVFVNLQYGDCKDELSRIKRATGRDIITFDDLDLRDDFAGTAALIQNLDLVISAGTAVHMLTSATETPCFVFFFGKHDSDPFKPERLHTSREIGFVYPPLVPNKLDVVNAIAASVKQYISTGSLDQALSINRH
ncbi:tetratricopeptide repeat protein [Parasalinivibrio latis]|uniref:tetratricopeptide repeat protein n=1 Tax=Parasalinivibrio latis TaxID=2952610 RepID=UPI0030DEA7FD